MILSRTTSNTTKYVSFNFGKYSILLDYSHTALKIRRDQWSNCIVVYYAKENIELIV